MAYQKIHDLQVSEQPRQILYAQGKDLLRVEEVLAILIGTGIRERSALDLAREILQHVEGDLNLLGRWGLIEFQRVKGIGQAKAAVLVAALELGRRRMEFVAMQSVEVVRSSMDAYQLLKPHLADLNHEEFWVIYLNRAARLIKKECVSRGGLSGTVVDSKMILKAALQLQASSLILAHNHPSGQLSPSQADKHVTQKLISAAGSLDMIISDHLILTSTSYVSFADEGWL
ncbi:MAG: hypothetical protein RIQ98_155 [Bacteroidota bacterium]|jgi:DNA repair protein RadC